MTRRFLFAMLTLVTIITFSLKVEAKEYKVEVDGKKITLDAKNQSELEEAIDKKYLGYKITAISDDLVKAEKFISIIFSDGGKEREVSVPNIEVSGILKYLNVKLKGADFVLPELNEKPFDNRVAVFRVEEKVEEKMADVDFKTIEEKSTDFKQTKEIVVQEGKKGLKKVFQKNKYINGIITSSVVVKEAVIYEAVDKIVKLPPIGADIINRGDLRSFVMSATAYEAGPLSTGKRPGQVGYGITASGTRARRGTVAVDRKVIPLGTKLYIKSLDPDVPDYGYAIAEDTGGAIKGMKIDLFMDTVYECFQFGRRKVQVFILPPDTPRTLFR